MNAAARANYVAAIGDLQRPRTWWSVIRIEMPAARCGSRRMLLIVTGSMPVKGSSSRMILGLETSERAISGGGAAARRIGRGLAGR